MGMVPPELGRVWFPWHPKGWRTVARPVAKPCLKPCPGPWHPSWGGNTAWERLVEGVSPPMAPIYYLIGGSG